MKREKKERLEALIRIIVFFVSGIILVIWGVFIYVIVVINLLYTLFIGKRMRTLAEMGELWNTQIYIFQRYIIFESNKRPFPFRKLERRISKFEK